MITVEVIFAGQTLHRFFPSTGPRQLFDPLREWGPYRRKVSRLVSATTPSVPPETWPLSELPPRLSNTEVVNPWTNPTGYSYTGYFNSTPASAVPPTNQTMFGSWDTGLSGGIANTVSEASINCKYHSIFFIFSSFISI